MENTANAFTTCLVGSEAELRQIQALQAANLRNVLTGVEMASQGFVTLRHSLDTLNQMHKVSPSVIIKHDGKVVAYALTMGPGCRQLMPDLEPMYRLFETIAWQGTPLESYRYYVMGQICIESGYRGMGLFQKLYSFHREIYSPVFDLLLTEISRNNHRSLRAHLRTGFRVIHEHTDPLDNWAVVGWDWSQRSD